MKSKNTIESMKKLSGEKFNACMASFMQHVRIMVEADSDFYIRDISSINYDADFFDCLDKLEAKYADIRRLNFKEMKAAYEYFSARTMIARNRAQRKLLALQEETTELINKKVC